MGEQRLILNFETSKFIIFKIFDFVLPLSQEEQEQKEEQEQEQQEPPTKIYQKGEC